MKKFLMMALVATSATTAFAQDDLVKQASKMDNWEEAVKAITPALTSDATTDKAKAYNTLVDITYKKFEQEDGIKTTNQVMQKNDPFDKDGMLSAGMQAIKAAIECDKYDQQPNEKGKVKIRFRNKNADRLKSVRIGVLNAAIDFANEKKDKEAFEAFDLYLTSGSTMPFGDEETAKQDPNRGVAAFYGGRSAVQLQNYAKACDFFKIGVQDTAKQIHDLSFEFLLYCMRLNQKTAEDSVKYLNDMKALYAQFPDNDQVYGSLADAYLAKGDNAEVLRLADERLAKDPKASLPHVYKAFLLMGEKKFDESIAEFNLVPEDAPAYLQCVFNRAVCKYNKAAAFNEQNSDMRTGRLTPENDKIYRQYLNDAQVDFEKAQKLDPDQMTVKWGYLLKNIYLATGQEDKANAIL